MPAWTRFSLGREDWTLRLVSGIREPLGDLPQGMPSPSEVLGPDLPSELHSSTGGVR